MIQTFIKLDELLSKEEINGFLKEIDMSYHIPEAKFDFNFSNFGKRKLQSSYSQNSSDASNSTLSNSSISESQLSLTKSNLSVHSDGDELTVTKKYNQESKRHIKINKKRELIAMHMGTTANIVYFNQNYLYVANVGDSFSVMFKNKIAIKLNTEHKTTVISEEERINLAGSRVINNRVEGRLNLTRAIGNFKLIIYYRRSLF